MSRIETVREIWCLLKARKRYWLIPIVVIVLLLALLLFLAETSPVAPFIYTLF